MASWKINITNRTGSHVNVMVFQTVPDDLMKDSYFTAWKVVHTPDPGNFDLELPDKFEFYVVESERKTGPFEVSYGQAVDVLQTSEKQPPTVTIKPDESVPANLIKVFNRSGNAQKLEMALFKNGRKMVFYKDIRPGYFLFMAIKPTVYLSAADGAKEGQEFLTSLFVHTPPKFGFIRMTTPHIMSDPRQASFELLAHKPVMNIQITQEPSGEYKFTLIE